MEITSKSYLSLYCFFLVSLLIQQMYREVLAVADETGGRLKNRCVFFCDEFGTLPKIESAEMMFSASRSRRLQIVPIIQSFAQLEKNYGKEGAEIIVDNTQLTIFGGFAPNSSSAEALSKALGSRTVLSGSVSRGKNDPSQSLQMIERPLMTPDELKSMPRGQFVVMKTGFYPMKVRLKLFFRWGITFGEEYVVEEKGNRRVAYAGKERLMDAIIRKYQGGWFMGDAVPPDAFPAGGQAQGTRGDHRLPLRSSERTKGGGLRTSPRMAESKMAETGMMDKKIRDAKAADVRKSEKKNEEMDLTAQLPVSEMPWDMPWEMEGKGDGKA